MSTEAQFISIQASPTRATVLHHSKAGSGAWIQAEVFLPDSTSDEITKNSILKDAYLMLGECCHCTNKATGINLLSFRIIDREEKKAKRMFLLVDHCSNMACAKAAVALAKKYTETMAEGSTRSMYYKCMTCKKTAQTMSRCTGCQSTYYCNAECERMDRDRHKPFCHPDEKK